MVLLRAFAWGLFFWLLLFSSTAFSGAIRCDTPILRWDHACRQTRPAFWLDEITNLVFYITFAFLSPHIGELHFDYATVFCPMSSNGHHSIEYTLSVYTYVYLYTSTPHSTTETDQNGRSISSTLSSFFPDSAAACCSLITSRINATSAATYCF